MKNQTDIYRKTLRALENWDDYLLQESRLPGPRANLELANAVAEEGDEALFKRYLAHDAVSAPTNDPHEFLAFCGVLGLGRLLAEGQRQHLGVLRAAAALCHPDLLHEQRRAKRVLDGLDAITASLRGVADRRSDKFKALRNELGYCWSVAVCASPEAGKKAMERWFGSDDRDVQWIMKQNLRKKRLERMDAAWVAAWKAQME